MAGEQHGVVTRAQLLDLGVDASAIRYRLKAGRLIGLHRGVYAVGHRSDSMLARAMAAVLACGPGAALSHRSAGVLWKMLARPPAKPQVTLLRKRRPSGVKVHLSTTLTPADTTTHFGIPITSPARTLLDLADSLDDSALNTAVNEARLHNYAPPRGPGRLLSRSPGRATSRLRRHTEHATGPSRSELERRFLAFVDRYGLPRPEVNQEVAGTRSTCSGASSA